MKLPIFPEIMANKNGYALILFIFPLVLGCSLSRKMQRGTVAPENFTQKVNFTTAKGIVLVPAEFEGTVKNYLFDSGSQLTSIQRTQTKGRRVTVRGASNRTIQSGTEVLKSFKIGGIDFRNTFATNEDYVGLKEQIPNFGGILGRPIIDRANWLIDMPKQEFIISSEIFPDEGFTEIPLEQGSSGADYTRIEIDGKTHKAIVDLGSVAMLNVPIDNPLASELLKTYDFEDRPRERYTIGGLRSIIEKVAVLPELRIGYLVFKNVEVSLNQSSQVRVGMNLFRNAILNINSEQNSISIKIVSESN